MSYITKNSQGPVTVQPFSINSATSYITKNSQGPVTTNNFIFAINSHTLLKIHRVL